MCVWYWCGVELWDGCIGCGSYVFVCGGPSRMAVGYVVGYSLIAGGNRCVTSSPRGVEEGIVDNAFLARGDRVVTWSFVGKDSLAAGIPDVTSKT